MHKDRPKHNQAEITALIGDVTDKICILNDDMIDTGGSLVAAAATLKAKGAAEVYACATHGLFSGPAYERLENSCIEEVVVTNAVPVPLARQTGQDQGALHRAAVRADHRCCVQQRLYWEIVRIAAWLSGPSPRGGSPRSNSIEARIASRASGSPFLHFNELRAGPLPGDLGLLFQR